MKTSRLLALAAVGLVFAGAGCAPAPKPADSSAPSSSSSPSVSVRSHAAPTVLPDAERQHKQVRITTAKGDIVIQLDADTAPLTVSNFLSLAKDKFFDGLTFHRREEGFVIQGGDPRGDGTGDPGYRFKDELGTDARWEKIPDAIQKMVDQRAGRHLPMFWYHRGIVAMANSGPDTNGSQFFIMLADQPLPKNYTIFGKVVSGMEVVDKIAIGDVMTKVTVEDAK